MEPPAQPSENEFLDRLREKTIAYREAQNLTQEQLGDKVGISQASIYRWEAGKTLPRPDAFSRLVTMVEKWHAEQVREEPQRYGPDTVDVTLKPCPHCHHLTPTQVLQLPTTFCAFCAGPLGLECPNPDCGKLNPTGFSYCGFCQEPLTEEAAVAKGMAAEDWRRQNESRIEKQRRYHRENPTHPKY